MIVNQRVAGNIPVIGLIAGERKPAAVRRPRRITKIRRAAFKNGSHGAGRAIPHDDAITPVGPVRECDGLPSRRYRGIVYRRITAKKLAPVRIVAVMLK